MCSLMAEEDICKTSKYSTSHWLELALIYVLLMLMWLQLKFADFRKLSYLLASTGLCKNLPVLT